MRKSFVYMDLFSIKAKYIDKAFTLHYENKKKSDKVVFLFHDFPGTINKHYDIAEMLTLNGFDVVLLHYIGLGMSLGDFNFIKSIEDSKAIVDHYVKENNYESIHFISHGYGSFIALNLIRFFKDKLEKNLFIAPISNLPDTEKYYNFYVSFLENYGNELRAYVIDNLLAEIDTIKKFTVLSVKSLPDTQKKKITFIQGEVDEEVFFEDTKTFQSNFFPSSEIFLFQENHNFSKNRFAFLSVIKAWINGETIEPY